MSNSYTNITDCQRLNVVLGLYTRDNMEDTLDKMIHGEYRWVPAPDGR